MLQNIRDKSQGIVVWTIVGCLIITFVLWGVHSYLSPDKNNPIVAVVDKQVITQNDIQTVYQRMRQQQQVQLGANFSLSRSVEQKLKKQAMQQLVLSRLLVNASKNAGYRVTLDQVNQALLNIPAFQENGQFSKRRFNDILGSMMYTQDQFLEDMRYSMLINQAQGGYISSAFALPSEVDKAIGLINQTRDMTYCIIPLSRFNQKLDISGQYNDIKAYYQQHQAEFESPEQVSINYLLLSLDDIQRKLHFDKNKLQQYYKTNIQNYTKPAQWKVATILFKIPPDASSAVVAKIEKASKKIYAQLQAGANFSVLAKKYSGDGSSSAYGGELAWFNAGTLDPIFEKAVANLQKIGDISPPIKTAYGFNIVKLLGYKKAKVLPFTTVSSQINALLAQQHAERILSEESDKLSNLTYTNPDTLDIAAKALHMDVRTTDLFGRNGLKSGILANPRVLAAVFSNDVLQRGNNSDLLQLDPKTVMVLRVKLHKPASILPLADVQSTIQEKLRNKIAQQKAQQFGEALIAQLKNDHRSLVELAKHYGLLFQIDKNIKRYDAKIDVVILNQAFKIPRPSGTDLSIQGLSLPSGDYAVIKIDAVHEGTLNHTDISTRSVIQKEFEKEVEVNMGYMDYQFYVKYLMEKAKIKYLKSDQFDQQTKTAFSVDDLDNHNDA